MTIKFIADYPPYEIGNTVALTSAEETALVAQKVAVTDLTGGVPYVASAGLNAINKSRSSEASDSGKDPLKSTSASAITYTLLANIAEATRIRQDGAGVVTVSGDSSVEMIGSGGNVITSLATTGVGSMILIEPIDLTVTPKKYLVIKGGA